MFRPTHIERTKTILIVVLFMTTILLFYFLWKDISFGGIKLPMDFLGQNETEKMPLAEELIVPESISVNFGGDLYTKISNNTNDYWLNFSNEFSKFGENESIVISEITKAQYEKATSFRSMEINFGYWLPFLDACNTFKIKTQTSYSIIEAISKITYSLASPESILIYDGKNNKFFRMAALTDVTKIKDLILRVENVEQQKYYQLGSYLGIENSTLMPVVTTSQMNKIEYNKELYDSSPDILQSFAESFFGKGFDFVRKITENDNTIIYMYGYGEKILILNTNGKFEYKEEFSETDYQDTSYFDSLDLAISFISEHGGWSTLNGNEFVSRLVSSYQIVDTGKKGYKFIFQANLMGQPISYESSPYPIVVTIVGSQITSYQRDVLEIDQSELDKLSQGEVRNTIPPIEIISKEYVYINDILSKEGDTIIGDTSDQLFEFTALKITNISTGFFKSNIDNESVVKQLIPAWIIDINKTHIYFDLYSGEPLGYSKDI
jgi:hypothetical protein